jgi:hypothetical protein
MALPISIPFLFSLFFCLDPAVLPKNHVRRLAVSAISQRDDPTAERQFLGEPAPKLAEIIYTHRLLWPIEVTGKT